ncbi:hypothetical protein ASPZODRAFT_2112608 [Penicilliopsis zonata CBS 506.65]|uniref:Major facilitator superfamily (MFS) profile domain-containing protein n=1 Tax=Penicilliopsis zonata CBS 506.65 TaxID=1073090 RepID=A0A1L9SBE0_9EURO|nr:hypothetical protein ASPZODRAFT_2112608 [Penicilliopsis zonata CBS 506.65]OJJ44437.1 hypothetical protein ASPZODRAFT_2112608 [Penicilliopsis zonata CBS 506.65]
MATEETPLIQPPRQGPSFRRKLVIAAFIGVTMIIQTTNVSMMTTTQSLIAADLDAFDKTTWFTSAYLIPMSSASPLSGRLSHIFTPRVYLIASCALMSLGLFVTASAHSLAVFLTGRAIAGCAAGGLMGTSTILILELASTRRRGLCLGMLNAGYTTGIASGAIVAGLVAPKYGWQVIFWFQAFIMLAMTLSLFVAIPPVVQEEEQDNSLLEKLGRVDYAGAIALAISVFLLLFSLSSAQIQTTPLLLSILAITVFLAIESRLTSRGAEPIIPISILKMRSVVLTCAAGMAAMMTRWSVLFYTPIYTMAVRGWSPGSAGLILLPTNAGFGLGGLVVGAVHIKGGGGYYTSCVVILVLLSIFTAALSLLSTASSPVSAYILATFVNGFCAGAMVNYTLSHILHLTATPLHYIITALVGMSRGFAGSFGSAIGGGLFTRVLKAQLESAFHAHEVPDSEKLIRRLLGSPTLVSSLEGVERNIAIEGYQHATRTLFLTGAGLVLVAAALQAGTGWEPETKEEVDEMSEA